MIIHTAVFKTQYAIGSASLDNFLVAAQQLAKIPGVEQFKILPQISKKTEFQFALYMEFASQQHYDAYNLHPDHQKFVTEQWLVHVDDFIELDYQN